MITLDLRQRQISLDEILDAADQDTVVIIRTDGTRLLLEPEDAFEQEAAMLGQSESFMSFLAERSRETGGITLEDFARRLEETAQTASTTPTKPERET